MWMVKYPLTCSFNCMGIDILLALVFASLEHLMTAPVAIIMIVGFLPLIVLLLPDVVFILSPKMFI